MDLDRVTASTIPTETGLSIVYSPQFVCESPDMSDPLSEVITLLRPRTVFSKRISGAGRWGVRYSDFGEPSFCTVLEGSCRLAVDGHPDITLEADDFVLLPATPSFTISGFQPVTAERIDPKVTPAPTDEVRHGTPDGRSRRAAARRLLRVRLARHGVARVAAADGRPRARRRAALGAGPARRRRIERTKIRPRPRAHAPRGGAAHRSAALNAGRRRASGTAARVGRRATCAGDPADARPASRVRGR